MPDSHHQDPYNFLLCHSHVSSSQEPFLCDLSVEAHSHHSPSPSPASADSPPHSNAIVMVSPPDSQDSVSQDVSHTPPGKTSTPSFCDQPRVATEGDVDAGTPGFVDFGVGSEFVDLGMDSVLGLSEVQLTQEMGVDECSHGARRDVLGEIRDGRFDEFAVFDRELSEMDESPGKKPKLSEGDLVSEEEKISDEKNCSAGNLETLVGNVGLCDSEKVACIIEGSKSSDGVVEDSGMEKKSDEERVLPVLPPSKRGPLKIAASESECLKNAASGCVEVQSQKVKESVGNCEGNLVSEEEKISDENNCSAENLETLVGNVGLCESEKVACIVEGSKSSDGVVEDSGMEKKSDEGRVLRVLPPSMRGPVKIAASESECLKNAASGVEFGNSREKKNVFDVLRVLSEISNEEEDNLDDISLSEVAEACGITFPRPRWWPPEWEN